MRDLEGARRCVAWPGVAKQKSAFAENRTQLSERWSLVTGVRRDYVHVNRDNLVDGSQSDKTLTGTTGRLDWCLP